jgi:DNA-binding NtrC family response regulator
MEQTMKILILDDEEYRHDGFRRAVKSLPEAHQCKIELIHAYNSDEAMQAFQVGKIDVFFSDHDLGYLSDDGSRFATKVLMEVPDAHWPTYVVVHSANWQGARNIGSKFRSANIETLEQGFDNRCFESDRPIYFNWIDNCAYYGKPWPGEEHGWRQVNFSKQEDNF